MPASGGDMERFGDEEGWSPVASSDARNVAFYSKRTGNRDLFVRRSTGARAFAVTRSPADDYHPDWSPDGRSLVFVSTRDGQRNVWVMNVDGSDIRALTSDPVIDQFPKWSPDGERIVFSSTRRGGIFRLWCVPPAGGAVEPLTEGPALYPRWSPDGSRVYFTGWQKRGGNIWSVGADGAGESAATALVGRPGTLGILSLAVSKTHIYFSWEEDLGDLWVMDFGTFGKPTATREHASDP